MSNAGDNEGSSTGLYRMGAVASLTGLPAGTIRAWERRYSMLSPERTDGGFRLYTELDIKRLSLIQRLRAFGEPISAIANLEMDDLRERLRQHSGTVVETTNSPVSSVSVMTVGLGVTAAIEIAAVKHEALTLATSARDVDELLDSGVVAEVLVIEKGALGDEPLETFRRVMKDSRAKTALIIYDFSRSADIAALTAAGARLLRYPISPEELVQVILDQILLARVQEARREIASASSTQEYDRLYADEALVKLQSVSSSIDCECPNHLSAIIRQLNAFERYSNDCLAVDPDQEQLHTTLAKTTGQARRLVEEMLAYVCHVDNIVI